MRDGFDVEEFVDFAEVLRAAASTAPKKSKKFLRKEGSKLARRTKARAKREIGTDHKKPAKYANSKHYVDTIKRSKLFDRFDGSMGVSAYSSARHAHLIENGHVLYSHGKATGHFVPGKFIFQGESLAFRDTYIDDTEKFVDDVLSEVDG
jgi:hypothetical protein|nr:MAG TPA: putative tail-component [Caudoviricetes sp.]